MTDLQSLHRALSEAEAGSRELDLRIAIAVEGYVLEKRGRDRKEWLYHQDTHRRDPSPYSHGYDALPRYTTSLDAITSLIERKLPGWGYGVNTYPNSDDKRAWCEREGGVMGQHAYASSSPLALCIALVSALIAKTQNNA